MYIADHRAITTEGNPVQVVRVGISNDAPFRCRADALHEVHSNLSLANLDWDDLREAIGESGVFDGFSRAAGGDEAGASPRMRTLFFDDVHRPDRIDDDWQPEPKLPPRVAARRHFVSPAAWVVVLTDENAKPGKARVTGTFGEYRAAMLFEQSMMDFNNHQHTEVVQIEFGQAGSNFMRP